MWSTDEILETLDDCCEDYSFPALDNGYVYLAATRLSLFRSAVDWALVVEVFGFSPRGESPDVHIYTFASRLCNRNRPEDYVSEAAYQSYLDVNPHNESRFAFPVESEAWLDPECVEFVAPGASDVRLRSETISIPSRAAYAEHGIDLADSSRVFTFELCRYLSAIRRDAVLATPAERRCSVPPELTEILVLDEWHHPDVIGEERPSRSETFRSLARVLVTGDTGEYQPVAPPNTHWRHWPEGGTL